MIQEFDLINSPLEGTNLIEAGAGTGKTYNIAGLYIRLLLEKRLKVNEILVVTFTIAATEELKDRIRRKIIETIDAIKSGRSDDATLEKLTEKIGKRDDAIEYLDLALKGFDEAAIFTIHGFCRRVLHDHAFESGGLFESELIKDQRFLLAEIGNDFWRGNSYNASALLINYLNNKTGEKVDSPAKLLRILAGHFSRPFIKIIPKIDIPDIEPIEEEFKAAFDIFKVAWPEVKNEIEQIMLASDSLNRKIYNQSQITGWLAEMDILAAGDNDNPVLFDKFQNFTTSKLNSSLKKGSPQIYHPFFEACEQLFNKQQELIQVYEKYMLALKVKLYDYITGELKSRKSKHNVIYYDDLLSGVNDALNSPAGERLAKSLRHQYKAALIDEFQDTDPLQYNIFKTIFKADDSILFLIGDPKQAIYGFRGADIFAYMDAINEMNNLYTLSKNWRSSPDLIDAVNEIFQASKRPFIYDWIPFIRASAGNRDAGKMLKIADGSSAPLELWFLDPRNFSDADLDHAQIKRDQTRDTIALQIAAEISGLLTLADRNEIIIGTMNLKASDIAILVRTNNEASMMKEALSSYNIPAVLFSEKSVFAGDEAEQLLRALAGIAEPGNENLVRAALTTDLFGEDGNQIYAMITDDSLWENCLASFRQYYRIWKEQGVITMFRRVLIDQQVRARLLSYPDGERRLTNYLHLGELLHKKSMETDMSPVALVKWLGLETQNGASGSEESQLRLESDENAVRIITIHKSKGLEFPVVFCPFNWGDSRLDKRRENIFHDADNGNQLTLDLGSDDYKQNKYRTELELLAENLRLLYVSLTRAKYRCYLVWGLINKCGTSALSYLLHQPNLSELTNIIDDIEQNYASLSADQALKAIAALREKANNCIEVAVKPSGTMEKYVPITAGQIELSSRPFTGIIERSWRISSFSHLSSGRVIASEFPDYDFPKIAEKDIIATEEPAIEDKEPEGIFAFPKGARPGIFFHDLLQNLDFARRDNEYQKGLINAKLREYNYDLSWEDTIQVMINNILNVSLKSDSGSLKLAEVSGEQRLNELEFYYPLGSITPAQITKVFKNHKTASGLSSALPSSLERLQFSPVKGFMKGFIDLVFEHDKKYYLIDWKSNHLGNGTDFYSPERLMAAMVESFYFLQYHIYTVAANRFLSLRLADYNYDRDFGGIFYIFLRGLDASSDRQSGIFYDKPPSGLIDDLSTLMLPGK